MAMKKAVKRKTAAKKDVGSDLVRLEQRIISLDHQLEEAERQKNIFKDQAARLEGQLSAVEDSLKWEKNEYRVREAELEGKIEGMERAMKILSSSSKEN